LLRVGLTGGVACGKSTVSQMLVGHGALVLQADKVARELMQPGSPVFDEVVRCFGREMLDHDGHIDRQKLATAAFFPAADGSTRIAELNRIVHPAVIARQEQWMDEIAREHSDAIAVVEAALILEAGVGSRFDRIVVVTCSPEQKVERFAARHGISLEDAALEVARRSAAQLPESEKVRAADFVIDNSESLVETERQVEKVMAALRRTAKKK